MINDNNPLNDSILLTVKKLITGADEEYTIFDPDLVVHINTAIMQLRQLGVGPQTHYTISGADNKWSEYLENAENYEATKSAIVLMVKNMFDPPSSSYVLESNKKIIDELQWRLLIEAEMEHRDGE